MPSMRMMHDKRQVPVLPSPSTMSRDGVDDAWRFDDIPAGVDVEVVSWSVRPSQADKGFRVPASGTNVFHPPAHRVDHEHWRPWIPTEVDDDVDNDHRLRRLPNGVYVADKRRWRGRMVDGIPDGEWVQWAARRPSRRAFRFEDGVLTSVGAWAAGLPTDLEEGPQAVVGPCPPGGTFKLIDNVASVVLGCVDEVGRLHGRSVSWGSDGNVSSTMTYTHGASDGEWRTFRHGRLTRLGHAKAGKAHGHECQWTTDGTPIRHVEHRDGSVVGWTYAANDDGQLEWAQNHATGAHWAFDPEGALVAHVSAIDDEDAFARQEHRRWHANGALELRSAWENRRRNGETVVFDARGVVVDQSTYRRGFRIGKQTVLQPDGKRHTTMRRLGKTTTSNQHLPPVLPCQPSSAVHAKERLTLTCTDVSGDWVSFEWHTTDGVADAFLSTNASSPKARRRLLAMQRPPRHEWPTWPDDSPCRTRPTKEMP